MKITSPAGFFVIVMTAFLQDAYSASMLRVSCDGAAKGAKIHIEPNNGKAEFKGPCPIDIQVEPGKFLLRAHRESGGYIGDTWIDSEWESFYYESFEVGNGVIIRAEVSITDKYVTQRGGTAILEHLRNRNRNQTQGELRTSYEEELKRRNLKKIKDVDERIWAKEIEREKARLEELKIAQQQEYSKLLGQAESGDMHAAYQVGLLHEHGNQFISKNPESAKSWYQKAADSGHLLARLILPFTENEPDIGQLGFLRRMGDMYQSRNSTESVLTDEAGNIKDKRRLIVTESEYKTSIETGVNNRFGRVYYANQTFQISHEAWIGLLFSHNQTEIKPVRLVLHQFGEAPAPYVLDMTQTIKHQMYRDTEATRQEIRTIYLCDKTDACMTLHNGKKKYYPKFSGPR